MATVHKATGALVVVRDTTGVMHYFQRGQAVSVDADAAELKRLRDKGLLEKVKVDDPAPPADVPPDPQTLPAERDTRPVWEAYAVKVGIDPAGYSTKPELVEAVTKAHEAKANEGAGSGSGDGGSGS